MSLDLRTPASTRESSPGHRRARVLRIGAAVADRLSGDAGTIGRVHSVFGRALNIETLDGRLLTLHGPGPLRAPFAAVIDRLALLRAQRPGAPVAVEPGRLRLPGLTLEWVGATRVECTIPGPPPGLHRSVVDILRAFDPRRAPALDTPRGVAARAALSAAIVSGAPRALVSAARALLGLGEGLTPAGDDCLVGALAVVRAIAGPAMVGAPAVARVVAHEALHRTTALGREFVIEALAGRFSEPVLGLLRARSADAAAAAARALAGLGATSGADTLTGMRLACGAFA